MAEGLARLFIGANPARTLVRVVVLEFVLGADEYFVVGDNRGMPMELHTMGRVTKDRLMGPVLW